MQPSPLEGEGGERSEPGEGLLLRANGKLGQDRFEHAIRISQNVAVPVSNDTVACFHQPTISHIVTFALGMLPAIHFDDQLPFVAAEIGDKAANWHLSAEFECLQLP